jgi:hypothetical protein
MNRRTLLKSTMAISFLNLPANADTALMWTIIGRRRIRPNIQHVTFVVEAEIAGCRKLGIELKGNSLWLYELMSTSQSAVAGGQPVNLNIPPKTASITARVIAKTLCAQPKKIELKFEHLPLTDKPTEVILWGSG